MDTVTVIEYFVSLLIAVYFGGLILVWVYELRKNKLYRHMLESVRLVESFRQSMAVVHAKKYKVIQDYRRDVLMIERVQQFILENVLFFGKKSRRSFPFSGNISN